MAGSWASSTSSASSSEGVSCVRLRRVPPQRPRPRPRPRPRGRRLRLPGGRPRRFPLGKKVAFSPGATGGVAASAPWCPPSGAGSPVSSSCVGSPPFASEATSPSAPGCFRLVYLRFMRGAAILVRASSALCTTHETHVSTTTMWKESYSKPAQASLLVSNVNLEEHLLKTRKLHLSHILCSSW